MTLVDWKRFVKTIDDVTGRSPTRSLDNSRIAVGDISSFIAAISYFSAELTPYEMAKYSPVLLKHVYYGFLIELTEKQYLTILKESEIVCTDNYLVKGDDENIVLMTGTLFQWKGATITFSNPLYPPKLRSIFNAIYLYLLSQGLKDIFAEYNQKQIDGDTFILVEK